MRTTAIVAESPDALPSWNDDEAKKGIGAFVEKVTKEGSPDFVPVAERVATFDNDGTLLPEQPIYIQFALAFDRVEALAPQHPEWKTTETFASLLHDSLGLVEFVRRTGTIHETTLNTKSLFRSVS